MKVSRKHLKRKRDIVMAIRIVYDSLETHLDDSVKNAKNWKIVGSAHFQRKCVKEYAFVIKVLSDLL